MGMLTLTNSNGLLGSDQSDSQNGEPPHLSAAKTTGFGCKDDVQWYLEQQATHSIGIQSKKKICVLASPALKT